MRVLSKKGALGIITWILIIAFVSVYFELKLTARSISRRVLRHAETVSNSIASVHDVDLNSSGAPGDCVHCTHYIQFEGFVGNEIHNSLYALDFQNSSVIVCGVLHPLPRRVAKIKFNGEKRESCRPLLRIFVCSDPSLILNVGLVALIFPEHALQMTMGRIQKERIDVPPPTINEADVVICNGYQYRFSHMHRQRLVQYETELSLIALTEFNENFTALLAPKWSSALGRYVDTVIPRFAVERKRFDACNMSERARAQTQRDEFAVHAAWYRGARQPLSNTTSKMSLEYDGPVAHRRTGSLYLTGLVPFRIGLSMEPGVSGDLDDFDLFFDTKIDPPLRGRSSPPLVYFPYSLLSFLQRRNASLASLLRSRVDVHGGVQRRDCMFLVTNCWVSTTSFWRLVVYFALYERGMRCEPLGPCLSYMRDEFATGSPPKDLHNRRDPVHNMFNVNDEQTRLSTFYRFVLAFENSGYQQGYFTEKAIGIIVHVSILRVFDSLTLSRARARRNSSRRRCAHCMGEFKRD
jgi:hypothetical protein